MKFYKIFFNDFTDVNGNKIEVGNKYDNNSLNCDDIYVYFDLDELCKSFEDEYHDSNSYLMDFSIYEVDLDGDVEFDKNIKAFKGKCINILKEIDYSIFKDRSTYKFDTIVNMIKNKNEKLINKNFDYNIFVDAAVAHVGRGCDLNKLVHDNSVFVRREVSKHGRKKDLEILKNDVDTSLKNRSSYDVKK